MNLESDKRQSAQSELDFSPRGEARKVGRQEVESLPTMGEPESPANTCRIMEEVCERDNLREALQRVKSNKGSAGVDGMTIDDLSAYLKEHWPVIREQLLSGTYEPKPVRRVEIPKNRFVQQAVMQVLQRQWDPTFSQHSYGFRPEKHSSIL